MRQSVKKMMLTGAAVVVMMSFSAPAMAQDYSADSAYSPYSSTYGDPEEDTGGNMVIDRLAYFLDEWF